MTSDLSETVTTLLTVADSLRDLQTAINDKNLVETLHPKVAF